VSKVQSGNPVHDAACAVAAATQAAALAVATTQSAAKTADIAYFRTCRASAITNGVAPVQFVTALVELGTGGQ
jgi:hypothetical protein